jgi:serine/threonine-protein kinase RsbW
MMSSAQIQSHQLPTSIDSLTLVEQIIEDIKNIHGIPEELYGNILVSITEAVNNAIKHGNNSDTNLTIDFSYEFSKNEIQFLIKDKGTGFDRNSIPDPTHPDNLEKPDGRGIFIMESLSDEVEFLENGSLVCIKFNR